MAETLAGAIRDWMRTRTVPFRTRDICTALSIPKEKRSRVHDAIKNCLMRGEIIRIAQDRYRYNRGFRFKKRSSVLKSRIIKALYVANGVVTVPDIQRMADVTSYGYCAKVVHALLADGYVTKVKHGVYKVANRDRFRIECMGQRS